MATAFRHPVSCLGVDLLGENPTPYHSIVPCHPSMSFPPWRYPLGGTIEISSSVISRWCFECAHGCSSLFGLCWKNLNYGSQ